MSPTVGLRKLMGGTLTTSPAYDCRLMAGGCGGYIDTLLGPERTDVLSRQKIRSARVSGHTGFAFFREGGVLVLGMDSGGCVV